MQQVSTLLLFPSPLSLSSIYLLSPGSCLSFRLSDVALPLFGHALHTGQEGFLSHASSVHYNTLPITTVGITKVVAPSDPLGFPLTTHVHVNPLAFPPGARLAPVLADE